MKNSETLFYVGDINYGLSGIKDKAGPELTLLVFLCYGQPVACPVEKIPYSLEPTSAVI